MRTERLGRTVSATDTDYPNENADDSGPEGKKEQQSWADRIGIRIGPKAHGGGNDDKDQWARAEDQQPYADSHPPGLEISAHVKR